MPREKTNSIVNTNNKVAFKVYDVDGDGIIDFDDLFYILREMVHDSNQDWNFHPRRPN
jgi:Ca2+-binding EF-hand superfamily protein